MVPTPTSDSFVAAANEVKSSGADDPAAIKVAPATSSERFNVYSKVFKQMLRIRTILKDSSESHDILWANQRAIIVGKFQGHELDRIAGKLIQNKAFSRKIVFHEFRGVT